jgi:hypothetical protein
MTALPSLVSAEGEIVKALTAENLLHAAGIDPRTADMEALAECVLNAKHFASIAREAEWILADEMVHRMDRCGRWTWRAGDLTIKSSSPAAGTEVYDSQRLSDALAPLVGDGTIDREAMIAAVEWVEPPPPPPFWRQKPAGIKALLKLGPRVVEAIQSARVPTTPPRRSVKVSRTSARSSE